MPDTTYLAGFQVRVSSLWFSRCFMGYREQINNKVIDLGKDVLRMTTHAGSGHPSSGLSILHIVSVLMYDVMHYDPADPWNPGNDRLVLSEGHAVPAIY